MFHTKKGFIRVVFTSSTGIIRLCLPSCQNTVFHVHRHTRLLLNVIIVYVQFHKLDGEIKVQQYLWPYFGRIY